MTSWLRTSTRQTTLYRASKGDNSIGLFRPFPACLHEWPLKSKQWQRRSRALLSARAPRILQPPASSSRKSHSSDWGCQSHRPKIDLLTYRKLEIEFCLKSSPKSSFPVLNLPGISGDYSKFFSLYILVRKRGVFSDKYLSKVKTKWVLS